MKKHANCEVGKDEYKNWQLLHRHCHDVKTASDGSNGTRVKSQLREKRNERKLSRSVLKTSGSGEGIA